MAEIRTDLKVYWENVSRYRLQGCQRSLQWLIGMTHIDQPPLMKKALRIFKLNEAKKRAS